ncbi:hypothetical protein [Psychrobacter sp. JB385]|uniref:hypothetical protein n=1 Tax=Psychrobacter sp. JB385 TaxID=1434841 RepID=UPI00097F0C44|nr:hypothetical protein [Psychrobacter sp. JB385]SJN44513.1 hypothetical protein CZ794_13775 [Psychrobacter sp. JB385]
MKKISLCLVSLFLLISCAKPNVHDPNAQIKVDVEGDKYVIPLNHIVRPDTGSYASFETDMGHGYFFWPSGRGLNNNDKNPNIFDYDNNIIEFYWTAKNSQIEGADILTRINTIKQEENRDFDRDAYELEAYIGSGDTYAIYYIGNIDLQSPIMIRCMPTINEDQDRMCQMEYMYPEYNNYVRIQFSKKHLADWQAINAMAIDYIEKWHQD